MLDRLQTSQVVKVAILFAFGFTVLMIFFNSTSNEKSHKEMLGGSRGIMTGGLGNIREKDPEVVSVVEKVKSILEEKTNTTYESIDVLSYRHQTVAGKNYFVKARVKPVDGLEKIAHLRIYQDLKGKVELTAYEMDKTEEEELKYFQ